MAESKLGKEGHRERMRKQYLAGGTDNIPDHNLLELFLSIVIPRRDVKELSYDLINTFGSIEGVINASPNNLMTVKGVGESTAIAISLINKINIRANKSRNSDITRIINLSDAQRYLINELSNETVEKAIQINIKNNGGIINKYIVGEGNACCTNVECGRIINYALRDNCASVIVAHNHPCGVADASLNDLDFTFKIKRMLDDVGIGFMDHFIVAGDECTYVLNNPLFKKE